jgi:hypothetical protein
MAGPRRGILTTRRKAKFADNLKRELPRNPEYIVRLVEEVVRVSQETVRIVKALPREFA